MRQQKILLLGGGHAHALLLHHWKKHPPHPDYEIILISESDKILYTGMLPGWIAGHYQREELTISLKELCRKAGALFYQERVDKMDANSREVITNRRAWSYSLASLNLGIRCWMPKDLPKNETDIPLKPTHPLPDKLAKIFKVCQKEEDGFSIVIVGGGAGGVEVACALAWRLRFQLHISLRLVCRSFLSEYCPRARALARKSLKLAGVDLMEGFDVAKRAPEKLVNRQGKEIPARYVFWCTPGVASDFLQSSQLKLDANGFALVDSYLRSLSHPNVFAAGDVASLLPQAVAKAGVYAVRQAPYLAENLRRCSIKQLDLKAYSPQKRFLTILSLGEKKALAQKWNAVISGRMIWHWKDHLDRSFVQKF